MDIPELQAFLAVADSGSFSRAAERLHLTQPAVSKRIAALESGLRQPLFDRIARRVSLTEAGQALLPRARRLLADLDDTRRAIANLSATVGGTLNIATSHHIGLHHLPVVLRGFTRRFPGVDLNLSFMDSETACQAVERGEIELAIVTIPPSPATDLVAWPVWLDPLAVVVGTEHPLAGRGPLNAADLAHYPAILPAPSTFTRQLLDQAFGTLGLVPQVGMSTNYLETIKTMVSVGLGWSALPLTMVDDSVRLLPVSDLAVVRRLGAVRHGGRVLSNAARSLVGLLQESVSGDSEPGPDRP
jgi:DNA-binding transcriptional LysR family regulator